MRVYTRERVERGNSERHGLRCGRAFRLGAAPKAPAPSVLGTRSQRIVNGLPFPSLPAG